MKKQHLHHLVWALVALTTFVIGSRMPSSSDEEAGPTASRGSGSAQNRNGTTSEDRKISSRRGKSSRSATRDGRGPYGEATLTAEGIEELGTRFREGNLVERRIAFAEMLKNLTAENATELREHIADLPQDSPEFREFHYAWGAIAGGDAVLHGKDTPKRDMAAALAGWASEDPASAMAYFDSLSSKEQSNGALMKWGAVFGLADADPMLASEFAVERSQNGDKDASKMINVVASTVLKSASQDEATRWAGSIPEGDLQNTAYQRLAGEFAKEDPESAVSWAVELPDGEGKGHAIGSTFHQWANRDPRDAAGAINALPLQDQDAATYGYATSVVQKDPAVGIQWASNIRDPETRNRALVDTGRVFYQKNREAAKEWLAASDLPAEAIQRITGGK